MIIEDLEIEYQPLSEQEEVNIDGGWYGCYPYYASYSFSFPFNFWWKFDKAPKQPEQRQVEQPISSQLQLAIAPVAESGSID